MARFLLKRIFETGEMLNAIIWD